VDFNGSNIAFFNCPVPSYISVGTAGVPFTFIGDASTIVTGGVAGDTAIRANLGLVLAVGGGINALSIGTNGIAVSHYGIQAVGTSGFSTVQVIAPVSNNNSFGITVTAGTSASDWALLLNNAANNLSLLRVFGDGSVVVGNPSGGVEGAGTINAHNVFVEGVAVSTKSSGSFTGTLNGFFSGSITGTVNYVITGNMATLYATANIQATSGAVTMTMTGLPSAVQPASTTNVPCAHIVDNSLTCLGTASISGGTITFGLVLVSGTRTTTNNQNGFTASGTKGIAAQWSITYPIG